MAGLSRTIRGATFAAVSADESRAAEVGREILLNGGNAVDAAVAMYFAMAVTLPSAASLGASGACIVHSSKTNGAESFVFAPVAAPGPVKGVSFSIPTGVRAMTLMHVRHGEGRWEQSVSAAERMARFGVPVSRATIEAGQNIAQVLAARRGQGGYVNAVACPSGLRGSAGTCEGAIDPAGAGLALLAVPR